MDDRTSRGSEGETRDEDLASRTERNGRRDPFWIVLLLLPPILLFANLGDHLLWQDEAETALMGRAVALHGVPRADDGRNPITDQPGLDVNEDGFWIWSPWLQHYVVAAAFTLGGESTAVARLPFALSAWAALLLAYGIFRSLTRDRALARTAVVLLLSSVPFLLHARQSRYYALLSAFTLLHLYGYWLIAKGERVRSGFVLVAAAGVGLYQTFLPQLVASTLALAAHAVWRNERRVWFPFLAACAAVASVTLPIFLYTESWSRDYFGLGYGFESATRFVSSLRAYLLEMHLYAWPFVLALPWIWGRVGGGQHGRASGVRAALVAGGVLWVLAIAAPPSGIAFIGVALGFIACVAMALWLFAAERPQPGSPLDPNWPLLSSLVIVTTLVLVVGLSPAPYFRYLMGIVPLLALATAACIRAPAKRWVAPLLLGLLVATDLVHRGPFWASSELLRAGGPMLGKQPSYAWTLGDRNSNSLSARMLGHRPRGPALRSPLLDFAGELSGSYRGPLESILPILEAEAEAGDTIATTYEHFPLMFYTGLRVLRADWIESPEKLPRHDLPEWFWLHGVLRGRLEPAMREALDLHYQRVAVEGVEFYWENVPEPAWHRFATPAGGHPIEFYRRLEPGKASPQ